MTIKELKEMFPQDKYAWWGVDVNRATNNNYTDNDDVVSIRYDFISKYLVVAWKKTKPTLSKEKLDKVIELNRTYFKTPYEFRKEMYDKLIQAEEDCGEQIYDTNLLDLIPNIILSTRAHDTPNETFYKVYEALGYEIK